MRKESAVCLLPFMVLVLTTTCTVLANQYASQIILLIPASDETVTKAAKFLYQKNSDVLRTTVLKWDGSKDDPRFIPVMLEGEEFVANDNQVIEKMDFSETRIQVVGHGTGKTGKRKLGGLAPETLAEGLKNFVNTHSMNKNMIDISRISLVGCKLTNEVSQPKDTYAGKLLIKLHEFGIGTSISARTTLVTVDSTGRKLTAEIVGKENGRVEVSSWRHKNAEDKQIYILDKGNVLQRTPDPKLEANRVSQYKSFDDQESITVSVRIRNTEPFERTITKRDMYDIISDVTKDIFKNRDAKVNTVERRKVRERIKVENEEKFQTVDRDVRVINSYEDFVNEINYFGKTGQSEEPDYVYYRISDLILRMNTQNFYINEDGYMGIDNESLEKLKLKGRTLNDKNFPKVGESYKNMEGVDSNFAHDMEQFVFGKGKEVKMDLGNSKELQQKATSAQRILAMTLSESIRNFQTHVVNMLALDLMNSYCLTTSEFFEKHPMAKGGTWPKIQHDGNKPNTGFQGSLNGYSWEEFEKKIKDKTFSDSDREKLITIRKETSAMGFIWIDRVNRNQFSTESTEGLIGLRNAIISKVEHIAGILQGSDEEIDRSELDSETSLNKLQKPELSVVAHSEEKSVMSDSHVESLKVSKSLKSDQELIANEISTHMHKESDNDGTVYSIVEDSIDIDKGEIKFTVVDSSDPPRKKELRINVDEEKLASDDTLENVEEDLKKITESITDGAQNRDDMENSASHSNSDNSRGEGNVNSASPERSHSLRDGISKRLSIFGTFQGLVGAINSLEEGDTKDGLIGLAMTAHGIGQLTGINKDIFRSAGKALGKLAGEVVEDAGELLEDIPIVGTAFRIYNIIEDFSQHSVIGYIDGALDIAITGLNLIGSASGGTLEKITEPLSIALTVVRMVIDDFYSSIKGELDKLGPGANAWQKTKAVFIGIFKGILNFAEQWTLVGQIVGSIVQSHKLDEQYKKDREYLRNLSDYHNYFKIVKENGTSAEEINFADGIAAWNGGDITFRLGDSNFAHIQLDEIVDEDGNQRTLGKDIPRDRNLQDIVMGIGEAHTISFKKVTVKFLFFIPVHSKRLISGTKGDRNSLHGTYYGNSQNNRFFAVQQKPPASNPDDNYRLEDYYYALHGEAGNDSFYLGPQHTYVEGNEGEDTYYISQNSTHTDINNFATDHITDYLITTTHFSSLHFSRRGFNLYITSSSDRHDITIQNWFKGTLYQHMSFRSGDDFLFEVAVNETGEAVTEPYEWNKGDSEQAARLDLSQKREPYESVTTLIGSKYDDVLIGNDKSNHIIGGHGNDWMQGGKGIDTYILESTDGFDVINNFALDEAQDILFFTVNHTEIRAELVQGNSIRIFNQNNTLSVTLQNWFINSSYQHLLLASDDAVLCQISNVTSSSKLIRQLFVDMDLIQGRKELNMSSDEISVIGSRENDTIRGNSNNNYFAPGLGNDYIEGRHGADTYVIRPGEGNDTVYNLALDEKQDTILFGAEWSEIELAKESKDLIISAYAKNMSVRLHHWFEGKTFQHLVVRSIDGVVFTLPDLSEAALVKTPVFVDKGESKAGLKININEAPWQNVTKVLGSKFEDAISGNNQSNVLDPGPGKAFLRGRDGQDTYIIQSNYSEGNRIYNTAEDQLLDTLFFLVPFSHIVAEKHACSIELSSNLTSGITTVLLVDFMLSPKEQHLLITSSDGISFALPEFTDYQPVALIINRAKENRGQLVNLTAEPSYATVQKVLGSLTKSNHLVGNAQNNTLVGGNKADMLYGNAGNDVLKGGAGNDVLYGGSDDDILEGGFGNDTLEGGDGDDTLAPGSGIDILNGGNGTDTVFCFGDPITATGSYINLEENVTLCDNNSSASLSSIEGAHGSPYNDTIFDSIEDNILFGEEGNDTLVVTEGYDVLNGGSGYDVYDVSNATGTKVIMNYAVDLKKDVILMPYTNKSYIRYGRSYDYLVLRVAAIGLPEGYFNATVPTILISNWYQSDQYKHIELQASDGIVVQEVIEAYAGQLYAYVYDTENNVLVPVNDYIGPNFGG